MSLVPPVYPSVVRFFYWSRFLITLSVKLPLDLGIELSVYLASSFVLTFLTGAFYWVEAALYFSDMYIYCCSYIHFIYSSIFSIFFSYSSIYSGVMLFKSYSLSSVGSFIIYGFIFWGFTLAFFKFLPSCDGSSVSFPSSLTTSSLSYSSSSLLFNGRSLYLLLCSNFACNYWTLSITISRSKLWQNSSRKYFMKVQ